MSHLLIVDNNSLDKRFVFRGQGHAQRTSKRGPTPKWQQQIEAISALPKPKQRFVMEMLETVLAQASR